MGNNFVLFLARAGALLKFFDVLLFETSIILPMSNRMSIAS